MNSQPIKKFDKESLVSVIMPVYNGALFLSDTIQSILNQTYENFELLILDDCSTDNSIEIIKSFNDKRIRLYQNIENEGYIKGLNFLAQNSQGEYIARNDQDDISLPDRIYKQLRLFKKKPKLSIVGGQIKTFGKSLKKISYPTNLSDCRSHLLFNTCLHHPTVIFKRKKIERFLNRLYDETKEPSEDYDLWTRLSLFLEIGNVPDIILKYRIHQNNYSTLHQEKQFENNLIIRKNYFNKYLKMSIKKNENILVNKIIYNQDISKKDVFELTVFFNRIKSFSKTHNDYSSINQTISFYWLKSLINYRHINLRLFRLFVKNIKLISLKIFFNPFYIKKILYRI
jgi:glycosyltransferase involved in cell wall biosynthesis